MRQHSSDRGILRHLFGSDVAADVAARIAAQADYLNRQQPGTGPYVWACIAAIAVAYDAQYWNAWLDGKIKVRSQGNFKQV